VFGNGMLIFIFAKHKSLRNVPNTFIFCLSIGDFMVICGAVPFIAVIYATESWPFGEVICKLSEFLRDLSIGVSCFSLTVLSVDRYLAIAMVLKQMRHCRSKRMAYWVSAIIWLLAVGLAVPGAYTSHVMEYQTSNTTSVFVCYPFPIEWIDWYPRIMVMTKFCLLYAIPLIIISVSYAMLARHLMLSKRNNPANGGTFQPANYKQQLKSRAKVAKLVLVFVAIFIVSFLPNHVFMLWFYYTYPKSMDNYNNYWHFVKISGYVLSFTNSCLNPFVLFFSSGRFREYIKHYLRINRQTKRQMFALRRINSRSDTTNFNLKNETMSSSTNKHVYTSFSAVTGL